MSIFKRKAKPAKEAEAQPKKDAAASQAPMKSYKPRYTNKAVSHESRSDQQEDRNSVYSQQFYNQPKARSEEMFSHSQAQSMAGSQYGQIPYPNGEYLYQARGRSGGYDNTMPFARGRGKTDLGKEPGNMTPYYSSDSGYESADPQSAIHSRVPSFQNLQDPRPQYSSRASHNSFIPELRLGQGSLEQMPEIDRAPTNETARRSQEGILKNAGNASPVEPEFDARSVKSTKSTSKKTRFEDQPEPLPALNQLQQHREQAHLESSKQHVPTIDLPNESAPHVQENQSHESTQSLQLPPQTFETLQLAYPTTTSARRPSLPPLSILDGLKVNKKGKILDEEGDPIGELIDGDLLDCVRQKANEKGEVLDEYGRVVGTVRTLPSIGDVPAESAAPASMQVTPQPVAPTQLPQATRPNLSLYTGSKPDISGETGPQPATAPQEHIPQHSATSHVSVNPAPLATQDTIVEQKAANVRSLPVGSTSPKLQGAQPAPQIETPVSQTPVAMNTDESQHVTPLTPKDGPSHEHLQRPARTASERSLSELGRSYARPPMDSVPEDNVPEDVILPVESEDLFAYKGEIPLTDARLPSRLSIDPSISRSSLMPGQLSPSGRIPMASRRATTHFTGGYQSNNLHVNPKLAMMNHSRRSPLSSHETSPKRSDPGTDSNSNSDDMPTIRPGHLRTPSMRSAATTVDKPRTYFTHGGKITVDGSTTKPEKPAAAATAETVAVKVADKKKSRFSIGFGKKK